MWGSADQVPSHALISPTAILDIPVYKSRIHPLHVLFSLFLEFKNSQVCSSTAQLALQHFTFGFVMAMGVCKGPREHVLS